MDGLEALLQSINMVDPISSIRVLISVQVMAEMELIGNCGLISKIC